MSNIIPKLTEVQINRIPSRAEQRVYKAMQEQIPKDWLIIHSLEFIMTTSQYQSHGDREADFVVFSPDHGVLVIEVKGGGIEYDNQIPQWYSIDKSQQKHKIKNPLKQAKDAKYEIQRHIKQKAPNKNILIAHAALFPDIDNARKLINPATPIEILGVNSHLNNLKQWIISIFDYWAGKQPIYDSLESSGLKIVKEIYGKQITIQSSLSMQIEEEIEKQIELTNRQKNILRQLKRRKEAIIEGGAGTGKTLLALDHAQTLSKQGLKVLFLCYNQKLGNFLKEKSTEIENLHSMTFHEFCSWRIKQVKNDTGRDLIEESKLNYPNEDYFDILMPNSLIESYDISPINYDVIIIDEGQDFKDEYWLGIELLKTEETKLYIFKDANQAIYGAPCELPIKTDSLFLFDNCRNTKPIHELAYKYYNGEDVEPPDIKGEEIRYIIENTIEKQVKTIDKEISKLINVDNMKPEDIAIIIMNDYNSAENLLSSSKHNNLWALKKYNPKNQVLVETAKRFKGLEAKIIFIWSLDSNRMNDTLLYIAISRARFRLWMVGNQQNADYIQHSQK